MKFYDLHKSIATAFQLGDNLIQTPDNIDIHLISNQSDINSKEKDSISLKRFRQNVPGGLSDESIIQNTNFQYMVFSPRGKKNNKAIILLHGLNERKWDKYYTWGHKLVKDTGKSVILIPFSFHLNRGLPEWIDRHSLAPEAEKRKNHYKSDDDRHTFMNLALSKRLTESPERFFLSGLQSANDIISVLTDIKKGKHPLFKSGTRADIFGYSIGGLLAQVLYISNPKKLFKKSKLFLFCAGSLFNDMNGVSKVIMDPPAYKKLYSYYADQLEDDIKNSKVFGKFFNKSKIGMAFRSMIAPDRFKSVREKIFKKKSRKIFAIALKKDKVIPPDKIKETVFGNRKANMEVFDFDFPYTHEMPFPMRLEKLRDEIDEAFEKVFLKAGLFLS